MTTVNLPTADASARESILALDDSQTELVEVPQWGYALRVRALSAKERDNIERSILAKNGKGVDTAKYGGLRARVVQASVVDEHGQLLFTREDVATLEQKAAAPIEVLFNAAQRLSGMSSEDVAELEGE